MAIDFPDSPTVDQQYSVGDRTWTWNGTYWQLSQTSSTFTASDTAPVSPSAGDIWFESDTGQTFVYYDQSWVEIGAATDLSDILSDADADTSIQVEASSDEDVIRFRTAGTERINVDASGNVAVDTDTLYVDSSNNRVGIGTASPTQELHIYTGSANADVRIQGDPSGHMDVYHGPAAAGLNATNAVTMQFGTSGTTRMAIDSSGNVGIGTTSPNSLLEIKSDRSELKITSSEIDPLTNHTGRILFENTNISDTYNAAAIEIHGNTDAARNGSIAFFTNPNGIADPNGLVERMIIDYSGNVGIGTTTPEAPLEISGGTVNVPLYVTSSDSVAGIGLSDNSSSSKTHVTISAEVNDMKLSAGGGERVRIKAGGNVGIGENAPSYKLDVNGDINTTGNLRFQGTVAYNYVQTVYFTSNGSFTKASYPWLRAVRVRCQGAGGGGGGSSAGESTGEGGGGAGGYGEAFVLAGSLSASETIIVGSGGSGAADGTVAGSGGGNASFGSHAQGNGGTGAGINGIPGDGGSGSGDIVFQGGAGGSGMFGSGGDLIPGGGGGSAHLGGGGRGGRGGLDSGAYSPGQKGRNYGGGGGGAQNIGSSTSSRAGGNGAPGLVIVELYA